MSSAFDFEGFDPKESLNETLNQISRFVGILSALGCIFNVVVTICLGKSKYIFGKMVIILAIFDFSSHSPLIFTSFNQTSSRISCEIIGSWVGFFGFGCSVIFTTCLAHALYQILKDSSVDCVEQYFKKYVVLSLVTGIIAGTLAASLQYKDYHYYGNGKYLCITRHYDGFNWRSLLIVMTPATVSIVGCTFYYIRIIRTLKILNEEWHWGLLVYPLILIICILPTMIRRLSQLVEIRITSEVYIEISRGLFGAQGFLNSLAYGLSREVYDALRKQWCPNRMTESIDKSVSFSEIYDDETQIRENQHTIN